MKRKPYVIKIFCNKVLPFSNPIDSLAAAGSILASVWLDNVNMPVVDSLGDEFLNYVKEGMTIKVKEDGIVEVI